LQVIKNGQESIKLGLQSVVAEVDENTNTEKEMKTKKFKIEDALNATRAASQEGIIPGGGAALARLAPKLDTFGQELNDAEKAGVKAIRVSLEAPLRQIAANSGLEVTWILHRIQNDNNSNVGFDFANFTDKNWEEGIVDMMKEFAEREQLEIVETFVESQTAKEPGRPIFNNMLSLIEKGKASGILAWHPNS
jgi:chaperonin GroEL (HSP60 family)